MGVSNVGLIGYLTLREDKFVLVPQFNIDHQPYVTTSDFSDSYLFDWADGVIRMVFTVNPESVERRIIDILRITRKGYGEIKQNLEVWKKRVKKDSISTVFYPKTFKMDRSQSQVKIQGVLYYYFGTDRKPIIEQKTYIVGYAKGNRGLLFLDHLKEVSSD
jgi:type IV conjugative transfer system protein TraE